MNTPPSSFEQVVTWYQGRIAQGESPDPEQVIADHPRFAAELRAYFARQQQGAENAGDATLPVFGSSEGADTLSPKASPERASAESTSPEIGATAALPAGRPASPPPKTGRKKTRALPPSFGDYELLHEIARGGMGVVYKARQISLNRLVALKMILSGQFAGEEDVRRFRVEAEAAANLAHPNIVPVYEVGEHAGQHYFSMGYVEGESLADYVAESPLPPQEAAQTVQLIAEAMAHAHSKGVVHRDLKPANILLAQQESVGDSGASSQRTGGRSTLGFGKSGSSHLLSYIPKVTDFGLAKQTQSDHGMTATGQILGTPGYMPPEQASGNTTAVVETADIYSLGAILYCLLVGRPPFQAPTLMETLMQVMHQEPVPPRDFDPSIPRDLETIVLKCLQKDRDKRYPSATELVEELGRYLRGEPIAARPVGRLEIAWRWCARNPVVASLITFAALLLLVGTIVSSIFAVQAHQAAGEANQARLKADQSAKEAKEEAHRAELARAAQARSEAAAKVERDSAQVQRDLASVERDQAKAARDQAHRQITLTDMRLADEAADQGNFGRTERLLMNHIPGPDEPDYRGWEWYYLLARTRARMQKIPCAGESPRLLVSPVTGEVLSFGNMLRYWDAESGELIRAESLTERDSMVWRNGHPQFIVGTRSGAIEVYDSPTHKQVFVLPTQDSRRRARKLSCNAAGDQLLATYDKSKVCLWDLNTQQVLHQFEYPKSWVAFGALHPNKPVAAISERSNIQFVHTESGETVHTLAMPKDGPYQLAFSPDGRQLACGEVAWPYHVYVIDCSSSPPVVAPGGAMSGHLSMVGSVAWSPDGKHLASGSNDFSVRIWNVESGELVQLLDGHSAPVRSVVWGIDGDMLAAGSSDQSISLWRTQAKDTAAIKVQAARQPIVGVSWDRQGERFSAIASHSGLTAWRIKDLSVESHVPNELIQFYRRAEWEEDGRSFLLSDGSRADRVLRWNLAEESGVALFPPQEVEYHHHAISPNRKFLAAYNNDEGFAVWNREGERVFSTNAWGQKVTEITWSRDSSTIAVAAAWSIHVIKPFESTKPLKYYSAGEPASIDFNAAGDQFAMACNGGEHNGSVLIFDAATGKIIQKLKGHRAGCQMAKYSPDGKRIASCSADYTLKIWSVASGQEIVTLRGHQTQVQCLAWSDDGQRIVSGDRQGVVRVWNASPAYEESALKAIPWWVVGPFPGALFEEQEPVQHANPTQTFKAAGKTLAWQRMFTNFSGQVDAEKLFGDQGETSIYALTFIYSPTLQTAQIKVGYDDALTLWMNQERVYRHRHFGPARADTGSVSVKLRPGWNLLLAQCWNGGGAWSFSVRITNPSGGSLPGVRYSHTPGAMHSEEFAP